MILTATLFVCIAFSDFTINNNFIWAGAVVFDLASSKW